MKNQLSNQNHLFRNTHNSSFTYLKNKQALKMSSTAKTASSAKTAAKTATKTAAKPDVSLTIPPPLTLKRSYTNAAAVSNTPSIVYADEFDASRVQISPTCNTKSKIRSFNITDANGDRVLIQLDAGGRIPSKFGVDVTDNGKTYLRLTLPDKAEMNAMLAVPDVVLPKIIAAKDLLWTKTVSNEAVTKNFNTVFANAPQDKGDGTAECWDGSIKMSVPISDEGSLRRGVSIVDHDGSPVELEQLPGRKYSAAVFELGCVYLLGNKSGITKKLVKLQLEKLDNRWENVSFLPKRQRRE